MLPSSGCTYASVSSGIRGRISLSSLFREFREFCGRIYFSNLFREFREFCGRIYFSNLFCEFREFCWRISFSNLFHEFREFRGRISLSSLFREFCEICGSILSATSSMDFVNSVGEYLCRACYQSISCSPCSRRYALQSEKWWLPNHPPRLAESGEGCTDSSTRWRSRSMSCFLERA